MHKNPFSKEKNFFNQKYSVHLNGAQSAKSVVPQQRLKLDIGHTVCSTRLSTAHQRGHGLEEGGVEGAKLIGGVQQLQGVSKLNVSFRLYELIDQESRTAKMLAILCII